MNATPPSGPDFYVAGGTLDSIASSYIVRQADKELLDAVKAGQFCYILTSRQMGKSSLMVRTANSLKESDVLSVIIDLSDRDTTSANPEQWYLAQMRDITEQLGLHEDYIAWWQRYSKWGVVQRFTQFLTHTALKKISQPIVIFIDEIDSTLSLPFNCDDYFAMIRALYNKRAVDPALKRLTFVLLGVASPSDLIKDARRTPFNIGTRIQLTDFTIQETQPLISGLACDQNLAEKILENILFFTGGHPYLTQKTCLYAAKTKSQWNEAEASILIEKLIEEMFLSEAGQNTNDNIQFIRKRILSSKAKELLLQRYRLIWQKQEVCDDELDPIFMELKLSGLVKNDAGTLVVRNVIYERVFNETWITRTLSESAPILRVSNRRRWVIVLAALLVPTIGLLGTGGIVEYLINNEHKTSIPMVKVTIKLVDVFCGTKEAPFVTHDQFYVMTAFAVPDKDPNAQVSTQAQLSHPVDITSRQDLEFPNSPLTVFEGSVPQQGEIKGGFIAYNDQLGLEWNNISSWVADIKQSVASGLVREGVTSAKLASFATGKILNLATQAWMENAQLTSDNANELGRAELVVSASGHSSEYLAWQFSGYISVLDNWDYTVKYQIFRSSVDG